MAKKKNIPPPPPPKPKVLPVFEFTPQIKYTILIVLGFILYANTLQNGYAFDDAGIIVGNQYVQQGISGIKKIMTSDAFSSFLEKMGAGQSLSGGRYRPLSIVIFAIQQSIFGGGPFERHLFNLLCFLATIAAIYYFLSKYFLKHLPNGDDIAFVATILFVIHPIHTEVVANIKSLDEILSLLLILCTFIFGLKYIEENQKKHLIYAMISFLLALMSKEYGMMLVILLPLLFYLHPSVKKGKLLSYCLPYLGVFVFYMIIRASAVGLPHPADPNVRYLNNQLRVDPYYFATHSQKLATEWYSMGMYLRLLIFPYPLICDYSFAEIPYQSFSNPEVIFSLFAYIGLAIWGIQLLRKKDMLAFAVFFYLLMLLPVSNFMLNVGAMMGERFAYHCSLAFAVLVSYGLFYLLRKSTVEIKRSSLFTILGVLTIACGYEIIQRNPVWNNNDTLFPHDIALAPNNSFIDCNAGACYINMAANSKDPKHTYTLLTSAVDCLNRAIHIDTTFPDPYINLGLAYYNLHRLDSAKKYWDMVQNRLYPNHPEIKRFLPMLEASINNSKAYLQNGLILGSQGKTEEAIASMRKGVGTDSANAEIWYNLGGAYYVAKKFDSARYAWSKAVQIRPNYTEAVNGLRALSAPQQPTK
jgi:hypothetical protein